MENKRRTDLRRSKNGYHQREKRRQRQEEESGLQQRILIQAYVSFILIAIAGLIAWIHTDFTDSIHEKLKSAWSQSFTEEHWNEFSERGKYFLEQAGENAEEFLSSIGISKKEETKEQKPEQEPEEEEVQTVFEPVQSKKIEEQQEEMTEQESSNGKNQLPPEGILPEN